MFTLFRLSAEKHFGQCMYFVNVLLKKIYTVVARMIRALVFSPAKK